MSKNIIFVVIIIRIIIILSTVCTSLHEIKNKASGLKIPFARLRSMYNGR
jgi:hypothetical protein